MAHEIKLKIVKGIEILNTDISIEIKKDGSTFGTLSVSKGSIDWRPRKKQKGGKNEIQCTWASFDKLMRESK